MKLVDAASYFDRTPILDPVSGVTLFLGQLDLYDDSKRDAPAAFRRVLSTRPGTPVPPVVKVFGNWWLVGSSETDGLEEEHREKRVLQRCSAGLNHGTLAQFLASTPAGTAWASENWEKDSKQIEVSSKLPQKFQVYLPSNVSVPVSGVLWRTGCAYLVLSTHAQAADMFVAECEKLEHPLEVSSISTRTYDPVVGDYTSGAPVNTACLRVRWQALFEYGSSAEVKYAPGDCTLVFPAAAPVSTTQQVTVGGSVWQVLTVDDVNGVRLVHARPA